MPCPESRDDRYEPPLPDLAELVIDSVEQKKNDELRDEIFRLKNELRSQKDHFEKQIAEEKEESAAKLKEQLFEQMKLYGEVERYHMCCIETLRKENRELIFLTNSCVKTHIPPDLQIMQSRIDQLAMEVAVLIEENQMLKEQLLRIQYQIHDTFQLCKKSNFTG